ncbi:MAG: non-canonical purine NTP diphosphatase [Lewinellaceae bacterium]|nr:non-canonical purine NTP diphosphatase [Phaeodactylibacter sp.]MCB0613006.1 non-canonical purine NTP diphosphatase [Phaeodactylibacter sp.]MCB9351787.1 non-canonical purine NTP diphosphatase [Lewinellaceae bacterium]
MPSIVFATGNSHKVKEANAALNGAFEIIGLRDIGCEEELPETHPTLEGNALEKARYVHQHYQVDCFSEDTGLEAEALNGAPGVYSARYAGPANDAEANMNLLLNNLKGAENRNARFRTVIALLLNGQEYTFEGIVNGQIIPVKKGSGGFGYDPIFMPEGFNRTFAQMSTEEKNAISHRGQAIAKLRAFLMNEGMRE